MLEEAKRFIAPCTVHHDLRAANWPGGIMKSRGEREQQPKSRMSIESIALIGPRDRCIVLSGLGVYFPAVRRRAISDANVGKVVAKRDEIVISVVISLVAFSAQYCRSIVRHNARVENPRSL